MSEKPSSWPIIWFLAFCVSTVLYVGSRREANQLKEAGQIMYDLLSKSQKKKYEEEWDFRFYRDY